MRIRIGMIWGLRKMSIHVFLVFFFVSNAPLNFLKVPQAYDRVLRARSKDGTRTGACANM
ncbi:hypothetical protein HanPI659440_Chr09g0319101 [Helianthus annuus]|nr:hypothetical protein HanPI659440_Chr09g0319101 [Helianthus annuus]